ncbi:MAG: methyltransferase domain-containing protein [bacterium]
MAVALKLMPHMATLHRPDRIVEIGCGTGLLTQLVADRFPDASIEAIDIAKDMIESSRRRFAGNRRVTFQEADALTFNPRSPVPLVVSSSTLHWISPPESLFRNIARMLTGDGRIVFSLMLQGTLIELHESRRRVARGKPVLAALPDRDQILKACNDAGLIVTDSREEAVQVDYPSATDLLYALHDLGVTGGSISSSGTPLTRMELTKLLADYAESYPADNAGVYATYRVLYAVATPRKKV